MDTYLNEVIGKIELHNQSGTVCSLECFYKVNKGDKPKRIGNSGKFPLGQSKTLDLNPLSIPEGAWVTAYANVSAGKDSSGQTWLVFKKNNDAIAEFTVTGTAFSTGVAYNGIFNKEIYVSDTIDELGLHNQSGTVCSLECFYKVNKGDTPTRIGNSGNFPLGQSKTLDLNPLSIPEGAWVTAYANVSAGKDCNAHTWAIYKKNSRKIAEFTIAGVINFTTVSLNQIIPYTLPGAFEGYAVLWIANLDHTYVYTKADNYFKAYPCWGRENGGTLICKGTGDIVKAERIAGQNGCAGIVYGITGVCHQTANRILYPAKVTVKEAHGYSLSTFVYGVYGRGSFDFASISEPSGTDSYFNDIEQIILKYNKMEATEAALLEKSCEEFLILLDHRVGNRNCISKETLTSILQYKYEQMEILNGQFENKDFSPQEYGNRINELAKNIAEKFASAMTDADYKSLFDCEKGEIIEIVDIEQMQ